MFPRLSHLEWIAGRPDAAIHDLGSSDLRPVESDGDVVPTALRDLPDASDDATLETLLAAEYGAAPKNVLVTAGTTHANFLAIATAISRSEAETPHVLVEKPTYEPLVETPVALGARANRFVRSADRDYELEHGRVEAAMTDATTLVAATNHHNPSGRITPRTRLAEVNRVAATYGATVLVDETYAPFAAERDPDAKWTPLGGVSGASLSNTVVTNSLNKYYGLGELRIGWLVADEEFVRRARSIKRHVPAVAGPSRHLAARAISNVETLGRRSRQLATENYALLAEFLAERDDLDGSVSPGCTFAFPAHDRADGDTVAAAAWEAGVLVVPGRFFNASDRFRLSLGGPPDAARAGLDAFGDVLDGL